MHKRILIVEDEPDMLMGLKDNLEFEGYDIETASDGEEGLKKLLANNCDLVLLDVMLPGLSGFDVCKKARKENIQTPIIFLTAKGEELDKVIGLESGGDDYITKPFSLRELSARIKAVLRRTVIESKPNTDNHLVSIGLLSVDFKNYMAYQNGEQVKMSVKEIDVLHYLWKNKNHTLDRDQLLESVWGYDANITSRTIDNFILKLRHKVEEDSNHPQIILTVYGLGYKMVL
ncbi:response regulator transcription factor [Labilibacter sediminis]|nr:response regulator transcription factor [Labilibacter sediminis]